MSVLRKDHVNEGFGSPLAKHPNVTSAPGSVLITVGLDTTFGGHTISLPLMVLQESWAFLSGPPQKTSSFPKLLLKNHSWNSLNLQSQYQGLSDSVKVFKTGKLNVFWWRYAKRFWWTLIISIARRFTNAKGWIVWSLHLASSSFFKCCNWGNCSATNVVRGLSLRTSSLNRSFPLKVSGDSWYSSFWDKSNSTNIRSSLKAFGCNDLRFVELRLTLCKFNRPALRKASCPNVFNWFPWRSSTWISAAKVGTDVNPAVTQDAVFFPDDHLQRHSWMFSQFSQSLPERFISKRTSQHPLRIARMPIS